MKKIILVIAIIASMCGVSAQASSITWGNNVEIYDWSGAANLVLDSYTDYVIRLYESTDAVIDFDIVNGSVSLGNDTWTGYVANWNSGGAGGFGAFVIQNADTTYGLAEGNSFYTVIFSSSALDSGYCAVIDNSVATAAYPGGDMTYDPEGVTGGLQGAGGDWQAIPEPATFGLMAIGAGVAWLVRLKQRIG
jgi:hypothetical protein